jgi:hypothetical protein
LSPVVRWERANGDPEIQMSGIQTGAEKMGQIRTETEIGTETETGAGTGAGGGIKIKT